jgi:hypothetical protein
LEATPRLSIATCQHYSLAATLANRLPDNG